MITQLQLIAILGIGTLVGLLIFGALFVIGCILGPSLDDARQDMDWRGDGGQADELTARIRHAQADARRGK